MYCRWASHFVVELLSIMQEFSSFCWVVVQTKERARNICIVCIQIICIVTLNYKYNCASTNWEKLKKGSDTSVGSPTIFVALSLPVDSPHSQIWENRAVEFVKKDISRNCYWDTERVSNDKWQSLRCASTVCKSAVSCLACYHGKKIWFMLHRCVVLSLLWYVSGRPLSFMGLITLLFGDYSTWNNILKKTIKGQQLLRTVTSKSLLTDLEAGLDLVVKWWSLPGPPCKFRPINSNYTPLFSYFFLLQL